MEILIPGVLLVALMVFVSTRIKRSAARAFEREVIETEDFSLVKPEGFINPVNENSRFAFEAYSKDFGEDEASNARRVSCDLSVLPDGSNFDAVCQDARQFFDEIAAEKFADDDGSGKRAACLLEGEKTENEVPFYVYRKIVEDKEKRKIYDLKISVLRASREQYGERINEMLNGFSPQ